MNPKDMIDTLRKAGSTDESIRKVVLEQFGKSAEESLRAAGIKIEAPAAAPAPAPQAAPQANDEAREIADLCTLAGCPEKVADYLRAGTKLESVRKELVEAKRAAVPAAAVQPARVEITADAKDKFRSKAIAAICLRSGMTAKDIGLDEKEARAAEAERVRGLSLADIARESLEVSGVNTRWMGSLEICEKALSKRDLGHTTSDFPYLLATSAAKSLQKAYTETPVTYTKWCGKGSLVDFKTTDLVQVSGFSALQEVPQGMPIKQITMSDAREQAALKTYGGVFTLSRQALINDDLAAFTRIPAGLASAARRKINGLAYGILTANAAMSDGVALFYSTHGNLGSTAAISITTISEFVKLMGLQTDAQSNALNLFPKYFLVCKAKEEIARQYLQSNLTTPIVDTAAASSVYRGTMEVIADADIGGSTATKYFAVADPSVIDTVTMFFLNGQDMPSIREAESVIGAPQGISYEVFIDVVAKAVDYRGLVYNAGA